MTQSLNLTVVLGYESTLARMDEMGTFDREMALLRRLQDSGVKIRILSYGGKEELDYANRTNGMGILCNRANLPQQTYIRRIHQLHMLPLLKSDVLRTWQSSGLFSAHRASWAWQVPMILRMDYYWSELTRLRQAPGSPNADRIRGIERKALAGAVHIIVTTQEMAEYVSEIWPAAAAKTRVFPDFVDVDLFQPAPSAKRYDLVYIGRLSSEKNLGALLRAVKALNLTIAIVGGRNLSTQNPAQGDDEEDKLKRNFGSLDGRIHWLGRLNNEELPAIMNQSRVFVLCSFIEGQPRALIEAMACGMPIIGSNVRGTRNTIEHKMTGYLCGTDGDSIAAAIRTVLSNPELMRKMGANARKHALEHYALDQLARREYELLRKVVQRYPLRSAPTRLAEYVLRRNPPFDRTASPWPN